MRIRLLDCLHPKYCPAGSEGSLGKEEAQQGTIEYIELDNGEHWALRGARYVEVRPYVKLDEFIKATYGEAKASEDSGMRRIRG